MIFISIWNNIWPYLVAIGLFLILIIIHEFGHFIAAKSVGVKVNEFAVGFGPKLFSKRIGETLYKVNLLPLGGYCAMEGEDEQSEDSRAFCNKSAIRRFIVVAMGAIFNLLLGFILVGVTLIPENVFASKTIDSFHDNAISSEYGLMVGDEIIRVDGRRIYSTLDLSYAFTNVENGEIDITVKRNGEKKLLKNVKFETETEKETGIDYIKLDFFVVPVEKTFTSFISQTFMTSISNCAVVYRSLFDLLAGKYGISAMSGPVGVTAVIGNIAKQNLWLVIPIMALITINLGLFNLLPFPALDGGRLLFIFIEMVTKKKLSAKREALIHGIGFALLFAFMIFITLKDIWGLIV